MIRLGFLIFSVGVVGAILGAAKMPTGAETWPETLPFFIGAVVVGILGLVVWRRGVSQAAAAGARDTGTGDPATLLRDLEAPLEALSGDIGGLDGDAITERVDELLNRFVLPFAEVRQKLIDRMGMDKGADVLVTVAFGERMLNRVWSAAADGHLPEARSCFPDAHDAFVEAIGKLSS